MCLSGGRNYLLKCVVGCGPFYCGCYVAASILQMAGALPGQILAAIVSSDVERGSRVFLYNGLARFTYFYWLVKIRTPFTYGNLFFFSLCASASVLSLSRVYLFSIFCLTLAFLLTPKPSTASFVTRSQSIDGSIFVMSGMVIHSFNPFDMFSRDTSGAYGAMEYEFVRDRIMADPLRGFGITPDIELTGPFLGEFQIFARDLGPVGVWFDFGLASLCLYFEVLWWCSKPQRSLSPGFGWPLFITGCMLAANGCIAQLAIAPGGATITALIVAIGVTAASGRSEASTRQKNPTNRPARPLLRLR